MYLYIKFTTWQMSYFVFASTHLPVNSRFTIYNSSYSVKLCEAWVCDILWVWVQRSLDEAWFMLGLCRWCWGGFIECNVPITSRSDFSLFYTHACNKSYRQTYFNIAFLKVLHLIKKTYPLNYNQNNTKSFHQNSMIPCFMHKLDTCTFM